MRLHVFYLYSEDYSGTSTEYQESFDTMGEVEEYVRKNNHATEYSVMAEIGGRLELVAEGGRWGPRRQMVWKILNDIIQEKEVTKQ